MECYSLQFVTKAAQIPLMVVMRQTSLCSKQKLSCFNRVSSLLIFFAKRQLVEVIFNKKAEGLMAQLSGG